MSIAKRCLDILENGSIEDRYLAAVVMLRGKDLGQVALFAHKYSLAYRKLKGLLDGGDIFQNGGE